MDGTDSTCFSGSYPSMFKLAGGSAGVSVAEMEKVFSGSGWAPDSDQGYAVSDAMSAIQIAETSRDRLVYPLNYMLIDLAKAGKTTPERIIGGHCPDGAQVCRAGSVPTDGSHPLAWGGAKISTMCPLKSIKDKKCTVSYPWGRRSGARNDFGQTIETQILVDWLMMKNMLVKADAKNCQVVKPTTPYGFLARVLPLPQQK